MALTSHHTHSDFKVNNQGPFPPSWLKPDSVFETTKPKLRQNPPPRPPRRVSFLFLEKESDGVSLFPAFRKQEMHLSQIKEVSEISNNSILGCDHSKRTVERVLWYQQSSAGSGCLECCVEKF